MPDTTDALILYFADCIAATAIDYDRKSAPKHARMRHRNICQMVADHLEGKRGQPLKRDKAEVVKRLRNMANLLSKYPDPKC